MNLTKEQARTLSEARPAMINAAQALEFANEKFTQIGLARAAQYAATASQHCQEIVATTEPREQA